MVKSRIRAGGRFLGLLIFFFFFAYGAASFLNDYILQYEKIEGRSMEPFLEDGDGVFISTVPYWFQKPDRFQVIGLEKKHILYVKRIVGLPGETVSIKEGAVYIDGQILPENYGKETILEDFEPMLLGEEEYFVLGDNRNYSTDSRSEEFGVVSAGEIKGKVLF